MTKPLLFLTYYGPIKELNHPFELSKVNMKDYDGVIIPPGHRPVEDLYMDNDMGKLLFAADGVNKITGVVCHGQRVRVTSCSKEEK